MRVIAFAVTVVLLAVPAAADDVAVPYTAQQLDPLVGRSVDGAVVPKQDGTELYVPLTDEQKELPTATDEGGVDYVPGVEEPATPPASKQITDQVPQ